MSYKHQDWTRLSIILFASTWSMLWGATPGFGQSQSSKVIEFNRDVRPILSDKCFTCHGPDAANRKTKLRFDIESGATGVIAPGDPSKSKLYQRISSDDKALRMPPAYAGHDKLPQAQIDIVRQWI